jgi:AhpD family alkylhydroperoxidase
MDERMKRLIAIAASVGANCHPCLEFHIDKALELGIAKGEIIEALEQAKTVRKGAAASMDALALKLVDKEAASGCGAPKSSCCCSC